MAPQSPLPQVNAAHSDESRTLPGTNHHSGRFACCLSLCIASGLGSPPTCDSTPPLLPSTCWSGHDSQHVQCAKCTFCDERFRLRTQQMAEPNLQHQAFQFDLGWRRCRSTQKANTQHCRMNSTLSQYSRPGPMCVAMIQAGGQC